MYQFPYTEVMDDSPQEARGRERSAIEHSIELLRGAKKAGLNSRETIEAVIFLRRLWSFLIEDLANPENELSQQLRASLISIGLWIMREAEQVRLGKSDNIDGLIEISTIICEGLK